MVGGLVAKSPIRDAFQLKFGGAPSSLIMKYTFSIRYRSFGCLRVKEGLIVFWNDVTPSVSNVPRRWAHELEHVDHLHQNTVQPTESQLLSRRKALALCPVFWPLALLDRPMLQLHEPFWRSLPRISNQELEYCLNFVAYFIKL